jgi:hypothetical protein
MRSTATKITGKFVEQPLRDLKPLTRARYLVHSLRKSLAVHAVRGMTAVASAEKQKRPGLTHTRVTNILNAAILGGRSCLGINTKNGTAATRS